MARPCSAGRLLAVILAAASPLAVEGQGACVTFNCGPKLASCLLDSVCRTWSTCTMRCAAHDLACQIRCGDLYKPTDATAKAINAFSECIISEHHCVPQEKLTCKVPENSQRFNASGFDISIMPGTWYITRGWNPLFDCFDFQAHNFVLEPTAAKPLVGDFKYSVKKDLQCESGTGCDYLPREVHQSFAQDASNKGHLINHGNGIEELHYADDWYVLAAKADTYVLVYYCGCNDAACGYAGAVLYTRSPKFEALSADDVVDIKLALEGAKVDGLSLEGLCEPQAAACMDTILM